MHANIAFAAADNYFFKDFLNEIHLSYMSPSCYVLSHTILHSELARVHIEEVDWLKKWNKLTLLIDGWEDKMKWSLYGTVALEVGQYPVVLSLEDMTGHRGSADRIVEVSQNAMNEMGIGDGRALIALTTDNLTVMQSYQTKFKVLYTSILVRDSIIIAFK